MQQLGLRSLRIIGQIVVLYLLSEFGKWLMAILHIKFPGSIIGLLILLTLLIMKIIPEHWIASGAEILLSYMTLFFIPVTVGIINYSELISWQGFMIMAIILVSTVISIILSGKATQLVENHQEQQNEEVENLRLRKNHIKNMEQKGEA
ncbi:CidA/LrgA family protein [Rummeliibacillus pycnus]|uniref:CidA/LrgA family protein n=1 Tax=Rummeliibacillus pycnus TaxID=101070 RepID=UPI000C999FC3|nr:CidA/LrgA family holin-like protein [Rummeliibacillus pycnus]